MDMMSAAAITHMMAAPVDTYLTFWLVYYIPSSVAPVVTSESPSIAQRYPYCGSKAYVSLKVG